MVFTRYLVLADHLHNWPHYDLGFGAPSIDALHHRRRLCRSCQLTAIMIINGIVIIWIKSTSLKDSTIVIVLLALLHHHFCISFSFILRRLHPLIGCCPRKPLTLPPHAYCFSSVQKLCLCWTHQLELPFLRADFLYLFFSLLFRRL